MKFQLFLCFFISQNSLGGYYCNNDRTDNSSPTTVQLYNQCKKSFSAFFCFKALEQNLSDIASRCGEYGFGNNWKTEHQNFQFPFNNRSKVSVRQGEILNQAAQDMVTALPDLAEWLKKNAK